MEMFHLLFVLKDQKLALKIILKWEFQVDLEYWRYLANWSPNPLILLSGGTPWLLFPASLWVTESWCTYSFHLWPINTSHRKVFMLFSAQWNSVIYWRQCNMKQKKPVSLLSTGRRPALENSFWILHEWKINLYLWSWWNVGSALVAGITK